MAEVVGTVSAITSLVTLALQYSITLHQTVQSLQSRDKVIRELRQELEAPQGVPQALDESICYQASEPRARKALLCTKSLLESCRNSQPFSRRLKLSASSLDAIPTDS